jgi:glycerophosphoryl diester phosphodiesterase
MAHAPENTLQAFRLALRLGATGLESDVWVTADGVAVLHHDERVRHGLRGRPIGHLEAAALPSAVPTLEELYADCGTGFELSLDVKDAGAAPAVVAVARAAGGDAAGRLWLCNPEWERLAAWRALDDDVRLVCSTRRRGMARGAERLAAELADAGIAAVNLHHQEWSGGLTTLFHRFERLAFGWDAQHVRVVDALRRVGIDAVYGDHVDRLVEGLRLGGG